MTTESVIVTRVRTALRISGTNAGITAEIEASIAACKRELEEVGVVNTADSDALIIRAYILYAKADFDFCGKGDAFRKSFESLKSALAMAEDYNTAADDEEGDA